MTSCHQHWFRALSRHARKCCATTAGSNTRFCGPLARCAGLKTGGRVGGCGPLPLRPQTQFAPVFCRSRPECGRVKARERPDGANASLPVRTGSSSRFVIRCVIACRLTWYLSARAFNSCSSSISMQSAKSLMTRPSGISNSAANPVSFDFFWICGLSRNCVPPIDAERPINMHAALVQTGDDRVRGQ